MARDHGVLHKKYRAQLRRCAISGLRFYRDEMVRVAEDTYVYHKYLDEDYASKARGKAPGIQDDVWGDRAAKSLILFRPYGTPWAARTDGTRKGLFRGGVY